MRIRAARSRELRTGADNEGGDRMETLIDLWLAANIAAPKLLLAFFAGAETAFTAAYRSATSTERWAGTCFLALRKDRSRFTALRIAPLKPMPAVETMPERSVSMEGIR